MKPRIQILVGWLVFARNILAVGMILGLMVAASPAAQAQTLTTLHSFNGADGLSPHAGLVQGSDGNFYGTTYGQLGTYGPFGTVFKITPSGTLTTLYSFCAQALCADGELPSAGLIQGSDGNFYGTTYGGPNGGAGTYGTVFQITPSGTLTTLYHFCAESGCPDGAGPNAGLVQGRDGNFYGTTVYGGTQNCGTVFQITSSGTLTTLHSFCSVVSQGNCADGYAPFAGLVEGRDGNFYGATDLGGANGVGTIFQITPGGTLTTLYSFCSVAGTQGGCLDGKYPSGTLLLGSDGYFYGATGAGGANGISTGGYGTVFKITPSGTLTTLYSFCPHSGCTDGQDPTGALVQASDGNFYGTTWGDGIYTFGNVFEITPSGTLTSLYNFCAENGCTDGGFPYGGLVEGSNGDIFGTTSFGGANGDGTVFTLAPIATPSPTSLTFSSQTVGTTSTPQTVTLSNTGFGSLSVSGLQFTGADPNDFSVTENECTSALTEEESCQILVAFNPTGSGARSASLILTDNSGGVSGTTQPIALSGTGLQSASTTTSISAPAVTYGSAAQVTVSVTSAQGTVTGSVSLTVDNGSPLTQALSGGSAVFTIPGLAAGNHSLAASYSPTGSFAASNATGTLTVNQAPLRITASSGIMVYGGSPYVVGPIFYGFVNGDTYLSLTQQPACLPLFTSATPAGTYVSSCGGAVGSNYAFTYPTGSVTVSQASSAVSLASSSQSSDTAGQALTFTVTVTDNTPGSTGTPTGTVQFIYSGVGTIASAVPLVNGVASFIYAPIWAGTVTAE